MIFSCPKCGKEVNKVRMDQIQPLMIVDKNATFLGGGRVRHEDLLLALSLAPHLVAADGAAGVALGFGHMPEQVIGDFDSLTEETGRAIPEDRLCHVPEQDSTDFEKCLTCVETPMVLAVGFTGARIDHELAVYAALIRLAHRRCIVLGEEDICFVAPPELTLSCTVGQRVSLFPMCPVQGGSEGLKWPIEGLDFAPERRIGTSNIAEAEEVTLTFDGPGMLVILPRAMLTEDLIARLVAAPGWSGR